jgi:hypothetical protein
LIFHAKFLFSEQDASEVPLQGTWLNMPVFWQLIEGSAAYPASKMNSAIKTFKLISSGRILNNCLNLLTL